MTHKNIENKIDEALKKDIDFKLPDNFTEKVLVKISHANIKSDRNLLWMILGLGLFMLMSCLITIHFYWDFELFKSMSTYGSWALFSIIVIATIQFFDKKLVKERLGVSKMN